LAKLHRRKHERTYDTVHEIYDDIVDLAGVRIALYFPSDRDKVDALLRQVFVQAQEPKRFPESDKAAHDNPFAGYKATHYRVRLRPDDLQEMQKRYADARIEVQVASVLMHAWSEVEHDLVYKPVVGGAVSKDERDILNQLNGMILSGEIALEMLQRAVEGRITQTGSVFSNQYELASFLFNHVRTRGTPGGEPVMGRADALFQVLRRMGRDRAGDLLQMLGQIDLDPDRPVSEQVTESLIDRDPSLLQAYLEARAAGPAGVFGRAPEETQEHARTHEVLGRFLDTWREVEALVAAETGRANRSIVFRRAVEELAARRAIDQQLATRLTNMLSVRNATLHSRKPLQVELIQEALVDLQNIFAALKKSISDRKRKSGREKKVDRKTQQS